MISKNWFPLGRPRRKRILDKVRSQIESYGYSLEDISDRDLESAIAYNDRPIEDAVPLTGKSTNWILRRLSRQETAPLSKPE